MKCVEMLAIHDFRSCAFLLIIVLFFSLSVFSLPIYKVIDGGVIFGCVTLNRGE